MTFTKENILQASQHYQMPDEPELSYPTLVNLAEFMHPIRHLFQFDIQYASKHNFTGQHVYEKPLAYLEKNAAIALQNVALELEAKGLGIRVFDGYRPWYVTAYFWHQFPDARAFLADPNKGSKHNRGCAVDLTLFDLKTSSPLDMPSEFDEFNEKAHADYSLASQLQTENRSTLKHVMMAHDFLPMSAEWWHFDFNHWQDYQLLNIDFCDIPKEPV